MIKRIRQLKENKMKLTGMKWIATFLMKLCVSLALKHERIKSIITIDDAVSDSKVPHHLKSVTNALIIFFANHTTEQFT